MELKFENSPNSSYESKLSLTENNKISSLTQIPKQHACSCGKMFSRKWELKKHKKVHTGHKDHPCDICGKAFHERCDLMRHMPVHTREHFQFECNKCNKKLTNHFNLKYHLKVRHKIIEESDCSVCLRTFEKPTDLKRHVDSKVCKERFVCQECSKSFKSNVDLVRHERSHSGETPFKCFECGRPYSLKSSLVCHIRTHSGDQPYSCSICGRCFTNNGNMHQHLRKHAMSSTHRRATHQSTLKGQSLIKAISKETLVLQLLSPPVIQKEQLVFDEKIYDNDSDLTYITNYICQEPNSISTSSSATPTSSESITQLLNLPQSQNYSLRQHKIQFEKKQILNSNMNLRHLLTSKMFIETKPQDQKGIICETGYGFPIKNVDSLYDKSTIMTTPTVDNQIINSVNRFSNHHVLKQAPDSSESVASSKPCIVSSPSAEITNIDMGTITDTRTVSNSRDTNLDYGDEDRLHSKLGNEVESGPRKVQYCVESRNEKHFADIQSLLKLQNPIDHAVRANIHELETSPEKVTVTTCEKPQTCIHKSRTKSDFPEIPFPLNVNTSRNNFDPVMSTVNSQCLNITYSNNFMVHSSSSSNPLANTGEATIKSSPRYQGKLLMHKSSIGNVNASIANNDKFVHNIGSGKATKLTHLKHCAPDDDYMPTTRKDGVVAFNYVKHDQLIVDLDSVIVKTEAFEDGLTCPDCGCRNKSHDELRVHRLIHMPVMTTQEMKQVKAYECPDCGKVFTDKYNFKEHTLIHGKERPYCCEICHQCYITQRRLKNHFRIHNERKLQCTDCTVAFYNQTDLLRHMRRHSGERPFKCPTCTKSFALHSSLVKHLRVHSGEKPYECKICNLRFTQNGNMRQHMRTHDKEGKIAI